MIRHSVYTCLVSRPLWLAEVVNLGVLSTAGVWSSGSGAFMGWKVLIPTKQSTPGSSGLESWGFWEFSAFRAQASLLQV